MTVLKRLIWPLVSLLILAGCAPRSAPAPQPEPPRSEAPTLPQPKVPRAPAPPLKPVWRNGVWLERRWLAVPRQEAVALLDHLVAHGITDLYVRSSPLKADGTAEPVHITNGLPELAGGRGLRLWAWLPGVRTRVKLEDPAVAANVTRSARELIAAGFAGVQYDIEPVYAGDDAYLALLNATSASLPPGALLGVAAHLIQPHPARAEWTAAYFAQVADRVHQVALMAYDTWARSPAEYEQIMRYQTSTALANSPPGTEILIGVPTYEDRTERHTPETEPLVAALTGTAAGLAESRLEGRTVGRAIYAHWTTDRAEWAAFMQAVSEPPQGAR